jgi:hypothetical protein
MKSHLLSFALAVLVLSSVPALAQTTEKSAGSVDFIGKPIVIARAQTAPQPPPKPLDALRSGKLIYVKSSSLLVGVSVIEEKLQRRPEFQLMGLMVTRDFESADIVLELHHDLFTMYVYTAFDPKSNVVVASGKLSSLGGTVAGKVAERFLKQMLRVRQS